MTVVAPGQQCGTPIGDLFFEHPTRFIATLNVPEGKRAEYVERTYRVASPADDEHNKWALRIAIELHNAGVGLTSINNGYCTEAADSGHVTGAFIPDFAVQTRTATDTDEEYRRTHHGWYPADMLRLVGEITTPGKRHLDREGKYRAYAQAGIPVYVLIDRERKLAMAFRDPVDEGAGTSRYRVEVRVKIGDVLPLPDGLPSLDTSVLT